MINWIRVASGNYTGGRYRIAKDGVPDAPWRLLVMEIEDSAHSSLAESKARATEIEKLREKGNDPYWGGKGRFYTQGKRRARVKGL